jgi:hypothetical protein
LEGPSSPGACPGDSDLKRDPFLSEMAGTRPAITLRFAKEQPGFQRLLEKSEALQAPQMAIRA